MAMNSNSESKNNNCNLPMMVCVILSGFWFYNTKHVVMLISARRIIRLSHTCCIHVYILAKSKNDSCNALVSRHDDGTRTINTTCLWRQNNKLHLYMITVHNPKQKKQTYLLYNDFYTSNKLHAKYNRL